MSSREWKVTKWGALATLEYGKSLRDYQNMAEDVPVYGTNGLIGFTNKPLCQFPSVIIGRKGAYRGVHYSNKPFFVIDTAFYLKPKTDEIDLLFAYYQLLTQDINSMDSGSAIPSTSREDFYNLEINLPPLPTQRRITDILSALDDKIELNRQTNATLEAIAQAIFKEWFVDFNFPGATGEMVEGTLGMIPRGWLVGKLGDCGNIVCGKTPSKANMDFFGGEIPFIKIPDMHNSVFITKTEDSLTDEGASSQKTKFLPPFSVIVSCIATVGLVALTSKRSQTNQQINAIIPKNDYLSFYLYLCAKGLENVLKDLGSGGSATLNVNTTTFSNISCTIPLGNVLKSFDSLVRPLFETILVNEQQSITLATLRDALLPKLMSGEIEV